MTTRDRDAHVLDGSEEAYTKAWKDFSDVYGPLIRPISELDAETLAHVQQ